MLIQENISEYLNGKMPFQNNFTQKSLKENIRKLTNERDFKSFSKSYDNLYSKRKIKKIKIVKKVAPLSISKRNIFLRPLREFKEYVLNNFTSKEILGVYVHGSLGDGNYVECYSDFDALFILRKEIFEDKKKLASIRKRIIKANTFLYLLDPLQHHNLFVISELDMKYYFETIFPVILFKEAKEVTNFKNKLTFYCLEDKKELDKAFNSTYNELHKKSKKNFRFYEKTSAHIKLFIQNIVFLPTLLAQEKNKKYLLKKESFSKMRKYFNKEEWKIIEKCSLIRKTWKYESYYPYWLRKFIGFNLHYKILSLIHRYLDKNDFKSISKNLGKGYLEDLRKFLKKSQEILK